MAYGHPSIGILNVHINPYDNASMTIPQSVDIQSTFWLQLYIYYMYTWRCPKIRDPQNHRFQLFQY